MPFTFLKTKPVYPRLTGGSGFRKQLLQRLNIGLQIEQGHPGIGACWIWQDHSDYILGESTGPAG